jgi:dienelactone hydrolase
VSGTACTIVIFTFLGGHSYSSRAGLPTPTAPALEYVSIPAGGAILRAALFRPAGAGPFPAIVALHGCEGLARRTAQIRPFYREWGQRLAAAGFVVLAPNSYGSRGLESDCYIRKRTLQSWRDRVGDANAALHFLQEKPFVRADRISLLGWSTGATATLWTIRPPASANDRASDFRSAVALYPGCRRLADLAWSARVPTLILIGEADHWSSASACQQMVAGAHGRSALATIMVYPGAGHNFDRSNFPSRQRGTQKWTSGAIRKSSDANVAARTDALKLIREWFER